MLYTHTHTQRCRESVNTFLNHYREPYTLLKNLQIDQHLRQKQNTRIYPSNYLKQFLTGYDANPTIKTKCLIQHLYKIQVSS